MGISDRIESFIIELLKNDDNLVEIGRNELASIFNCVPSQINYVISTRFSPERGYIVESRRGGGGFLKIKRVEAEDDLIHTISLVGNEIDYNNAKSLIGYLYSKDVLSKKEAELILTAVSENSLSDSGRENKKVRAKILKNVLLNNI